MMIIGLACPQKKVHYTTRGLKNGNASIAAGHDTRRMPRGGHGRLHANVYCRT